LPWDDARARDNELTCTRRCGGQLLPAPPLALAGLEDCDFSRLPYPVALTARRLADALRASGEVLKALFLLKDCFEATIKYAGAVLLAEYRRSAARTPERTETLLKSMVQPSLGTWVNNVVRPLSLWLVGNSPPPARLAAALFAEAARPGSQALEAPLLRKCKEFVSYRNDALGHGAQRSDAAYERDLGEWLPLLRRLLDGVAGLGDWRACLVTAEERCQLWMGPQPDTAVEKGCFSSKEIGHFVLRRSSGPLPEGDTLDLEPFLCYLPDHEEKEDRLHYYDSLYRYKATKKEALVLEYDNGKRHPRPEPITGLERIYTAELLAQAFSWHRGRMEVIEGRVANFGELIEAHAGIVGRRFVVARVRDFVARHDRGLLIIEAQPGKGKTALMAHLIEEVFGDHAPPPVCFFYRRTAGITDPDVCVRSLYFALLKAHDITEAEEPRQKNAPEEVYLKLTNLLTDAIAPRLLPGRPQLLLIDALDEASGNAFQRLPENLPAGVFVLATTRPVSERARLARREDLHWYDLDAPDLLAENLRDGVEYVQRELAGTGLPAETLQEVARIGAGNFLVLKLLCQHLRTRVPAGQVADFLQRLATGGGKDQLGFIYAEFWDRLTERCPREDVNLLCGVAAVLVTAHAPLTADMVCGILGLRAGDWDVALRRLAEYLTVTEDEEKGARLTLYRVYHESFADFLRTKAAPDRERVMRRLADYCLRWQDLPDGYGRRYALGPGPRHLLEVGRTESAAQLLLDLAFLEAKAQAGLVFELVADFTAVVTALPESDPRRRMLLLLQEALRRDIHFLQRHPGALFQCLWNAGWWYDCPQAAEYYEEPEDGWPPEQPPWGQPGPKLYRLLEAWRAGKEGGPSPCWVRLLRPPREPLGTPQQLVIRGPRHVSDSIAFSPDGRWLVGGGDDLVRIWDANTGREAHALSGHEGRVQHVACSADGRWIASDGTDHTVRVWDAQERREPGCFKVPETYTTCLACSPDGKWVGCGTLAGEVLLWDLGSGRLPRRLQGHRDQVTALSFFPDGRLLATASEDFTVRLWDVENGNQAACLRGHEYGVRGVAASPDGRRLLTSSGDGTIRIWDAHGHNLLRCVREESGSVGPCVFFPDSNRFAYLHSTRVKVRDESGEECACVENVAMAGGLAVSPDGARIACTLFDDSVRVVPAEGNPPMARLKGAGPGIEGLAFSPDGRLLATQEWRHVGIWDALRGILLHSFRQPSHATDCLAWSPDSRLLATGSNAMEHHIWGISGQWEIKLRGFPFLKDAYVLTNETATVSLWDARELEAFGELKIEDAYVRCVALSPTGLLAVACDDKMIRLVDTEAGQTLQPGGRLRARLECQGGFLWGLAFSPDGRLLAVGTGPLSDTDSTAIHVWDVSERALARQDHVAAARAASGESLDDPNYVPFLFRLECGRNAGARLAFSSDGCELASASRDEGARIWDLATQNCRAVIPAETDPAATLGGATRFPWRAARQGSETVVEAAVTGEVLARFPVALENLAAHPSGRFWAGKSEDHLYLFTLEGLGRDR
jgi:WD40 repeat protein